MYLDYLRIFFVFFGKFFYEIDFKTSERIVHKLLGMKEFYKNLINQVIVEGAFNWKVLKKLF